MISRIYTYFFFNEVRPPEGLLPGHFKYNNTEMELAFFSNGILLKVFEIIIPQDEHTNEKGHLPNKFPLVPISYINEYERLKGRLPATYLTVNGIERNGFHIAYHLESNPEEEFFAYDFLGVEGTGIYDGIDWKIPKPDSQIVKSRVTGKHRIKRVYKPAPRKNYRDMKK